MITLFYFLDSALFQFSFLQVKLCLVKANSFVILVHNPQLTLTGLYTYYQHFKPHHTK